MKSHRGGPGGAQQRWLRIASWAIAVVPAGWGQSRVAQPVYRRVLAGRSPGEANVRFRGGTRLRLDLSDRNQALAFLTRDYAPRLLRFLEKRLRGGGVFVDVGAHVGLVSISVAGRRRTNGLAVHAFEPDPANAAAFSANLRLNPELNVSFNHAAVGASMGTATLQRSFPIRSHGRVVEGGGPGQGSDASVDVPMVTVDEYLSEQGIDQVAVLKVDVEGYEPAVLEGAKGFLADGRIECVVCEVNEPCLDANGWSAEILYDALTRHGYSPTPIPPLGLRRILPRRERGGYEDVAFMRQR